MATGQFLLIKRGLYYRPNDCGYTGIRDHAGRYTFDEAKSRAINGVMMMRADKAPEFSEACFDDLARKHLAEQRDKFRDALREIRRLNGNHDLPDAWDIVDRVFGE